MSGKRKMVGNVEETRSDAGEIELEEEFEFFESKKTEWLGRYKEKFVLIKGRELIDVFASFEDAYKEGVKRFMNQPFFIKQVIEIESIEETPSLTLGIIHANI